MIMKYDIFINISQYNNFISGNVLCLFVFSNKHLDLKPAFSNILKCLSVFDIVFLVGLFSLKHFLVIIDNNADWCQTCVMWLYSFPSFLDYQDVEAHATPYILPLTHIALTGETKSVY